MNGLERPVKKQRVSPLIPRYYQPLAKRVPGIAADRVKFRRSANQYQTDRVIAVLVGCQEIAAGHSGFKDGLKANSPSFSEPGKAWHWIWQLLDSKMVGEY